MQKLLYIFLVLVTNYSTAAEQETSSFITAQTAVAFSVATAATVGLYSYVTRTKTPIYNKPYFYGKKKLGDTNLTVFAHSLGTSGFQANYYQAKSFGCLENCLATFDFQDADKNNHLWNSALGQEEDMDQLEDVIKKFSSSQIDLYGVSRGAATIANLAGRSLPKNVQSIILESPYADIKDIIKHKTDTTFLSHLLLLCSRHDPKGIQPIKAAPLIDKNIPILILCSEEDTLVPASSSKDLYETLLESGHKKTHFLSFEEGAHGSIVFENKKLATTAIQAFYKKYRKPD